MKKIFDISEFTNVRTAEKVAVDLAERFKLRRKELSLTQRDIAKLCDVSYSSLRRFENTGEISLASLLKIAKAIESLEDFDKVFAGMKLKNLKDFKG